MGGKYRLGRKIGSGSFGDIYLGYYFFYHSTENAYFSVIFLFFKIHFSSSAADLSDFKQSYIVVDFRSLTLTYRISSSAIYYCWVSVNCRNVSIYF